MKKSHFTFPSTHSIAHDFKLIAAYMQCRLQKLGYHSARATSNLWGELKLTYAAVDYDSGLPRDAVRIAREYSRIFEEIHPMMLTPQSYIFCRLKPNLSTELMLLEIQRWDDVGLNAARRLLRASSAS